MHALTFGGPRCSLIAHKIVSSGACRPVVHSTHNQLTEHTVSCEWDAIRRFATRWQQLQSTNVKCRRVSSRHLLCVRCDCHVDGRQFWKASACLSCMWECCRQNWTRKSSRRLDALSMGHSSSEECTLTRAHVRTACAHTYISIHQRSVVKQTKENSIFALYVLTDGCRRLAKPSGVQLMTYFIIVINTRRRLRCCCAVSVVIITAPVFFECVCLCADALSRFLVSSSNSNNNIIHIFSFLFFCSATVWRLTDILQSNRHHIYNNKIEKYETQRCSQTVVLITHTHTCAHETPRAQRYMIGWHPLLDSACLSLLFGRILLLKWQMINKNPKHT